MKPTRQEVFKLIRTLVKRMEEEEFTISEEMGFDESNINGVYMAVQHNRRDTFTLKFLGKRQKSVIPDVTVLYPDGSTELRRWNNLRGLRRKGMKPIFLYCPIEPDDIYPESFRNEVYNTFLINSVHDKPQDSQ